MLLAQIDPTSRIIEVLAYSGAGSLVGFVAGSALRSLRADLDLTRREAETAVLVADEAKDVALQAQDKAEALD